MTDEEIEAEHEIEQIQARRLAEIEEYIRAERANGAGGANGYQWTGEPRRPQDNASDFADAAVEPFPLVRIADVPDEGPVRWLVRDIWLAEGVGIIGGEPKSFKSFFAVQLATCVAAGRPMFGRFEVTQGRVLMFNAEDRAPMTRSRVAKMCRALDVDIASLDFHLIDVPAIRLDDEKQMARLQSTVAALKPALLVLDPLRDLHGLDENDAQVVSALLAPLRVLQREHHCCVVIVHHMAKATETARRPGQRLRGSSALHGWVDSGLYLTHKDGAIMVNAEHRAAPSPDAFAFTVENSPTMNGGEALWLEAHGIDPDEQEEKRERVSELENAIIALLQQATEPLTAKDIRQGTKRRHELVMEAIQLLIEQRTVVEEVVTRGRNPIPGYRLNT